jgi:alcohol dehydrogenase
MISHLQLPSCVHAGLGSIEVLADRIERNGIKKVLLFTDRGVRSAGLCDRAIDLISEHHASCEIFDDIPAEPSVYDVDKVIRQASAASGDLILAIGGGSTMDTAKLASVLLGASYTVFDLVQNAQLAEKKIRSIFVPTTCGTGSEATLNAIVAIPEESSKKGIVNSALIPDEVILDVSMIMHLPDSIVAATGVDALAHCVECYTSKKATMLSNEYARAGARLIFSSLENAYSNPEDQRAKQNLMLGAFYGGVAITGSGTTAVHALSYPLGGKYHIAHGVSNAILFARVMDFNRDACVAQLAELCDAVYQARAADSADEKSKFIIRRISEIVQATNIPVSLKKFGITVQDLEFLVTAGSQQQRLLVNNCKSLSLEDIRGIYESVI